ncbi:MAG: polar amino acid transport system permease protein [Chloroflexota bacterium]|jgi:polar amino acid transport system permease protein|nr:polar amino acid transport system permease protein [Chloroflexota bacterium]
MSIGGGPLDAGDLIGLRGGSGPRRARRRAGPGEAVRSTLIALASTVVVFGVLAVAITSAPNWPAVRDAFFNGAIFERSWPKILDAFRTNVVIFLIAEVFILALGLGIAVLRGLPGPVFFPVRLIATVYVDLFRAVPSIVIIYLLGFGVPALGIEGVPNDVYFWGTVAIILVYSAYVSEVYRAGIDSVHWSQEAAARSLGLSRLQALRHVIVPQAIRRIVPPLLNDFIGLQKDTVLLSVVGIVEIFREGQILKAATFNFTPFIGIALIFVVITIPLARLTDWLVARDRRRQVAGGAR